MLIQFKTDTSTDCVEYHREGLNNSTDDLIPNPVPVGCTHDRHQANYLSPSPA